MSSELRESMDSIDFLLFQKTSPLTATSLSSRIHRASLESGGGTSEGATAVQSRPEEEGGRRGGSLNGSGDDQRRSSRPSGASNLRNSIEGAPSSLAPIAEPDRIREPTASTAARSPRGRDSLSYTPFDQIEIQQQQMQMQSRGDGFDAPGGASATQPATPFQNADATSAAAFRHIESMDDGAAVDASVVGSRSTSSSGLIVGSPSSAFSAVGGKRIMSAGTVGATLALGSPPFGIGGGVDAAGEMGATNPEFAGAAGGARTPSGDGLQSGARGSVPSAGRLGGRTAGSSRASGSDASDAVKRTTFEDSAASHATSSAGKHRRPDRSGRRETSLLVSPVSQPPSVHSRSPQSELSAILGSSSSGPYAGQHVASPPATANSAASTAPEASYGPAGTHFPTASAVTSPPAATFASQHTSPSGTSKTVLAAAPASLGLGPTGTPFAAPSSVPSSSSQNRTPAAAGLTIHSNLQPVNNGRDPTPYHYRSNPSFTSPYLSKDGHGRDKKDSDASSKRIGRDPPANSPFPTTINASGGGGASGVGFLVTSKSTPNVHSHHYHKNHQAEEQELSMIEEDESLSAEDGQSMVSNVTGPTFVRTPIGRKLHGHKSPHNNGGGHGAVGNSHGRPHHTPRDAAAQHFLHQTTPGSTASAAIHATPSKADLLHRPSLAMRESLAHLASTTSNSLEEIWDEVGVTPDDRACQIADLMDRLAGVCEAKIRDEAAVRDQFRKEIHQAREEWELICQSLRLVGEEDPVSKMRRDPSSKNLGRRSLQLEYEAMMGRLESLRAVKRAAAADLDASRGRILEAFAALQGCALEEAPQADEMRRFEDVETDLTQERRDDFRAKADEYEESLASRTRAIVSLLLDCQRLIEELEIVPPSEVSVGRCEDDVKIMNSLEPIEENADGQDDGHRRGQSHHYNIVSLFESPTCIGIGKSALDRVTNRITELNGEKCRRRARLGEMGSEIAALWTMLRVPQEEQRAFTASIRGLGLDTLRKGEAEIARLDDLKSFMIGKLVREQRQMIEELWDKTNSSRAERASFNDYFHIHDDEQLTSEVLVKHEEYVATLKSKLEKMQPILDHIKKREEIIEERIELEFLQKDPDRLKGRHASKQLMKEEKMNRRVKKELPRITANLEKVLRQWYEENKPCTVNNNEEEESALDSDLGHFMYQGSPYLKTIQSQEEEWRSRKERGEQERQRKRQEERAGFSAANNAFGYTTYKKLPGKKWNPSVQGAGARPHSASNLRSGSNMRSGSNIRSGGSRPATSGGNPPRAGSNMRFGGRGPLGDASGRQNASRPPSRPRGGAGGAGGGFAEKARKKTSSRHASAPRMRL